MYGVAVAGFCAWSPCKDILFKRLYFTRGYHYIGEIKARAVTEGPVKWSVLMSRLFIFNLAFFCTSKQVKLGLMSFWLDSSSYAIELMSINSSSSAATIYFGSCISLTV